MSESGVPTDEERRLANLQAVARHHAARSGELPRGRPSGAGSAWRRRLGVLGPLGLVLLWVLGKAKLILPLLKMAKLGTLVSMFVSVWAYAMFWGWPFAVGFVLLIFVHELGHAIVLWRQGIPAGAPVFIPFVGAVIAMKGQPRDAYVEALVGIGGPVLGSLGALVCLVMGWLLESPFWYALASTGFLINLFNLLPIQPLDGGRIVGVISRWLWLLGYALGIAALIVTHSPMLFLILLLGLFSLGRTLRGPRRDYYDVARARRIAMGAGYFLLVAALSLGMWVSRRPLEPLHEAQGLQSVVPLAGRGR